MVIRPIDQGDPLGGPEPMITAETVNDIVRFQANGLPVVSLYCRVDPGASRREVRARVDSLLDQIGSCVEQVLLAERCSGTAQGQ